MSSKSMPSRGKGAVGPGRKGVVKEKNKELGKIIRVRKPKR